MALEDDIAAHSNGAHFHRADLHIHSYGPAGSYDVKDVGMTPEAIVDAAIVENLKVIAITDHNVVGNVARACGHAEGKPVLVVPGVELSTQQGHLLMFCPTPDKLQQFYGKLSISDDKKSCNNTIPQCLKYAEECEGFGICAHIDQDAGLEAAHPKFDAFKQDILNCPNLLGMEITLPESSKWFSHADDNADRKNCAHIRRKTLGHEAEVSLAKVMGSDSHTLASLGRNASGQKRLTRFKMESLTFEALRVALLDCSARVRLEDLVPPSLPHFVGMKLEGGFLRDQVIHFSRNLTCIIGGRGAGKSTMLESLRTSAGHASPNTIVDSEVWPDCVSLIYEDEVGQRHTLTRSKLCDPINGDPDGPTWVNIESYGQGQTAETIQHCDKDPAILLGFLDGFINLSELQAEDDQVRDALIENQIEIERLQLDRNRIPDIEKAKKLADSQVAVLKAQKVGEVVELEQKLANERIFRTKLQNNLTALLKSINDGLSSQELAELMDSMDGSALAAGKEEFETVRTLVTALAIEVDNLSDALKAKVKHATEQISAQLAVWLAKEKQTRDRIEEIRRELEKQKIPLDIAFIRKVTKDATDHAMTLEQLKKSIPKQSDAFKLRRVLMTKRRDFKGKAYALRHGFATCVNDNLAACVVEYSVNLRYREGLLSPEFANLIQQAMNWRTSQVPRATLIAEQISPLTMLEDIAKANSANLELVKDADRNSVFSAGEAKQILETLTIWKNKCDIERCPFQERPEIKVTKTVTLPNGKPGVHIRDFAKLSLGQQQSILLTILLFSRSTAPLIIDQPEDNLDSEFIYMTLVRSLRAIKEHRQVIIVTHNANIAVLGDAELIIPLRAGNDLSVIRDRGSIDTKQTKDIVCTILEGSKKAFIRRAELYGV